MIDGSTTFAIALAPSRKSAHWKQQQVTWSEVLSWMEDPADAKESGSYLFGTLAASTVDHRGGKKACTGLHRRKGSVASRGILTLDVDHPEEGGDFLALVDLMLPSAAIVHTTFSSKPTQPRYRVLIPLDQEVAADEYHAIAVATMDLLGIEQFDPGSSQAERYMFMPSEQQPGFFAWQEFVGPPLDTARMLANFDPKMGDRPTPKPHPNKRNPFEIEGVVGAFNRAYEDFGDLITAYDLPYDPDPAGDRWRLRGARSESGLVLVTDGLVYSHHVNDPAHERTCSAFDLVRLHRFYELDEECSEQTPVNRRPSHKAMLDVAISDERVNRVLNNLALADFGEDLDAIEQEVLADEWKVGLTRSSRTTHVLDTISNWDLIVEHMQPFPSLRFNEFSMAVESSEDLPWRSLSRGGATFSKIDLAALCHMIERDFGLRPSRSYVDELVQTAAQKRYHNPVRDYLEGLEWDGTPRLEECLPGVEPTPYTRMVARKSLVAACARVFEPGCKWDHTLVLYGTEGLGKTFWIDSMSKGYAATLGKIGDKDTLITMQRSWIMVSDEGHSLKKADHEAQKEFLTRTEDIFRMPYDRESQVHKRHCVIWGTTNDEVFLRRQEGNRRFLIVRCENRADFAKYTEDYVDQVWAEAMHCYRQGETLYLATEESVIAAREREAFTEEDAQRGIVENYLDTRVPEDWEQKSLSDRQMWLADNMDGMEPDGPGQITRVCSMQVWAEAFGKRLGDHRRVDLIEVTQTLKSLPGWKQAPGKQRLPIYGPQTVFVRTHSDGFDLSDLV